MTSSASISYDFKAVCKCCIKLFVTISVVAFNAVVNFKPVQKMFKIGVIWHSLNTGACKKLKSAYLEFRKFVL